MIARRHTIGIDLGTSSLKAVLHDDALRPVAATTIPLKTRSTSSGESTQRFLDVARALASALAALARRRAIRFVSGVGVTTHRSSLAEWRRSSRRFAPRVVLWNDRRARDVVATLRRNGRERSIAARTGLPLLPYFFAPRAAMLVRSGGVAADSLLLTMDAATLLALGVDSPSTDPTYTARTLLSDRTGEYDPALLREFGLARERLAPVVDSIGWRGALAGPLVPAPLRGVPLTAALADQSAACLGLSGLAPRRTTLVLGTGTFVARATADEDAAHGVFPIVLARHRGVLLTGAEANDPSTGASFAAIRELLGVATDRALEALARTARSPVLVIPAAAGIGAPWLRPDARLTVAGVAPSTTRADVAAGLFEGVAARGAELLARIGGRGAVRTGGGGAASDLLLQRIADRSGRTIERCAEPNAGALAAAACARIGLGEPWTDVARQVERRTRPTRVFRPTTTPKERSGSRRAFAAAVERAIAPLAAEGGRNRGSGP